jgi:3-deoxy-D-manno-octulosonic-acid transferase
LFYLPILVLRGRWHDGFALRFGFLPSTLVDELRAKENIWVHAVSVGEVALVEGIIKELKIKYPSCRIVLSVTTRTGHAFAVKKYAGVATVIWSPLDLSWTVRRFVDVIRPKVYIVAETELWPNLFSCLERSGVKIVVVNGRISDEAYPRYRLAGWLFKRTMLKAALFCVQTPLDASRFIALGADKDKVHAVGNVKFDVALAPVIFTPADAKKMFAFKPEDKLWVAASTHPGEESVILDAFLKLRARFPRLRLSIAPRHPERSGSVAALVGRKGLAPVFLSALKQGTLVSDEVLLIDAVGHLIDLYRAADVVFVGKSLGIPRRGGQNPIEPAALAKPVIVGPHMENFRDIMRLFNEAGAVIGIPDAKALAGAVEEVLGHPERMAGLCVRAKAVVDQNRGSALRTVEWVTRIL